MVVPPSSIPKNHTDPNRRKAKAVFVVLARNSDLWALTDSMKQMEDRFNHWAGYDWVFLNDEPFDDVFKKSVPIPSLDVSFFWERRLRIALIYRFFGRLLPTPQVHSIPDQL
jgi:hypothetical protein